MAHEGATVGIWIQIQLMEMLANEMDRGTLGLLEQFAKTGLMLTYDDGSVQAARHIYERKASDHTGTNRKPPLTVV
jgi:hypothetical protein